MDIEKASKHLAKLNKFYDWITSDGEVNDDEKELLKAYVVNFYDSIGDTVATVKELNRPEITLPPVKEEPIKEEVKEVIEEKVEVVQEVKEVKKVKIDPKISSILEIEIGQELSDKLSVTAIKDISKSMSINEKIFTVNELFGGSQAAFEDSMQKLNGFSNFEEAKNYLAENVVESQNWQDPEKLKKVKTLMKLVYRKYV